MCTWSSRNKSHLALAHRRCNKTDHWPSSQVGVLMRIKRATEHRYIRRAQMTQRPALTKAHMHTASARRFCAQKETRGCAAGREDTAEAGAGVMRHRLRTSSRSSCMHLAQYRVLGSFCTGTARDLHLQAPGRGFLWWRKGSLHACSTSQEGLRTLADIICAAAYGAARLIYKARALGECALQIALKAHAHENRRGATLGCGRRACAPAGGAHGAGS